MATEEATAEEIEIQPYVEYYFGHTEGWDWFDGQRHWWEKFIVWQNGWNGLGQYACEVRWRWNGSSQTIRAEYVHLSYSELVAAIKKAAIEKATAT